jgi:hypothetical protein
VQRSAGWSLEVGLSRLVEVGIGKVGGGWWY